MTAVLFWKHDCPTCDLAVPVIDVAFYGSSTPLVLVTQSDPADTDAFVRKHGLQATVVADSDLTTSDAWNVDTVPTLFLTDRQGRDNAVMVGWDSGVFADVAARAGLASPDLGGVPAHRPGCGSRNVEPEIASRLRVRREGGKLKSRRLTRSPLEDEAEFFFERGLTDGLPVVAPTERRVLEMLDGTTREPSDIVATVPPNLFDVTVEKIAVNAVMAGCKPDYLPVVIAAVEAVCTDEFNMHGVLATTYPATPVLMVNGPIRNRIGMNSGHNALGQGTRANAAIGRALQLIIRNVGGGRPGEVDKATQGQPGKYTFCFAENEEASPWEPLHVERGFAAADSTITVYAGEGPRNVVDQISRDARALAGSFGLAACAIAHPKLIAAFDAFFIVSPEHCRTFAADGWTKDMVRDRIIEATLRPIGDLRRSADAGEGLPEGAITNDETTPVPKFFRREQIQLVVAGSGAGMFSMVVGGWVSGEIGSQIVTRRIDG